MLYLQTHFLQDHTIVAAIREAHGGLHLFVIDETQVLAAVRALFAWLTPTLHYMLTQ